MIIFVRWLDFYNFYIILAGLKTENCNAMKIIKQLVKH